MAHLQGKMARPLLSSRITTRVAPTSLSQLRCIPLTPTTPSVRLYHQSSAAQDKASSPAPSPSPRPQQNKERDSLIWQRGKRKEIKYRISTLAVDPSAIAEAEESSTRRKSYQRRDSHTEDNAGRRKSEDNILSRNQRRILLLSIILLMPVIGRDIMEVIIPGVLGTIIFVGGKIKSGIKWARQIGSGEDM